LDTLDTTIKTVAGR